MTSRVKKRPPPRAVATIIEEKRWKNDAEACRLLRRAASLAMEAAGRRGEVTVLLTGDDQVTALNHQFRGRNAPTNVLSFPSDQPGYLGDVAIAHGVVKREARAQGKSFAAHAAHLAAHGVLHLLGYDHENVRDAAVMEAIETRIMAELGIADPYVVREAA